MSQQMCAVSRVVDYGATIPLASWTPQTFQQYKVLLVELAEFDKATNQSDCADPDKGIWMADVERYLAELEQ